MGKRVVFGVFDHDQDLAELRRRVMKEGGAQPLSLQVHRTFPLDPLDLPEAGTLTGRNTRSASILGGLVFAGAGAASTAVIDSGFGPGIGAAMGGIFGVFAGVLGGMMAGTRTPKVELVELASELNAARELLMTIECPASKSGAVEAHLEAAGGREIGWC